MDLMSPWSCDLLIRQGIESLKQEGDTPKRMKVPEHCSREERCASWFSGSLQKSSRLSFGLNDLLISLHRVA